MVATKNIMDCFLLGETKESFFDQEAMPDGTEQPFTSLFCDKIAEGGLVQFESSTHPLHSMKPNSGGSVLPQHGMLGKHSSTMGMEDVVVLPW